MRRAVIMAARQVRAVPRHWSWRAGDLDRYWRVAWLVIRRLVALVSSGRTSGSHGARPFADTAQTCSVFGAPRNAGSRTGLPSSGEAGWLLAGHSGDNV